MSQQTYQPYFTGVIQDGFIYEQDYYRGAQKIGVLLKAYEDLQQQHNELINSYNEYQQILIDNDLIEVTLSQDEVIERQGKQIEDLTAMVADTQRLLSQMAGQINKMTEVPREHYVVHQPDQQYGEEREPESTEFDSGVDGGLRKTGNGLQKLPPKRAKTIQRK